MILTAPRPTPRMGDVSENLLSIATGGTVADLKAIVAKLDRAELAITISTIASVFAGLVGLWQLGKRRS